MKGDRSRLFIVAGMGVFFLLVAGMLLVFEPDSSPVSAQAVDRIIRVLGTWFDELASVFTG